MNTTELVTTLERLKGYYNDPTNGLNKCFLVHEIEKINEELKK